MNEYHKIQTLWLRDPDTNYKTLLEGQWAKPEFEYLADCQWIWTEKIDGTNIRVKWDGERVTFGGKTDNAKMHGDLVTRLTEMFPTSLMTEVFDGPVCLYGEGYGAGIQKSGAYRTDKSFILFDVKAGDWWLKWQDVQDIGTKLQCDVVPVVGQGALMDAIDFVRIGYNSHVAQTEMIAEGLVVRPLVDLFARNGERVIGKIKYKDFQR